MNSINEALILMGVGMVTVFTVLLLVILCSRALIAVINRWFPEQVTADTGKKTPDTIPGKVVAAITTAVNIASGGKAKIVKIEKK